MKKILISVALSLFVFVGCSNEPQTPSTNGHTESKYHNMAQMTAANDVRSRIGLRPISEDWFLYQSNAESDVWKTSESGFIAKCVYTDTAGNLLKEDDYYYSGRSFTDIEGTAEELITVRYDYLTKQIGVFYRGTNTTVKSVLAPYLMPWHDPTTNISQVAAVVRDVTKDWETGSKRGQP